MFCSIRFGTPDHCKPLLLHTRMFFFKSEGAQNKEDSYNIMCWRLGQVCHTFYSSTLNVSRTLCRHIGYNITIILKLFWTKSGSCYHVIWGNMSGYRSCCPAPRCSAYQCSISLSCPPDSVHCVSPAGGSQAGRGQDGVGACRPGREFQVQVQDYMFLTKWKSREKKSEVT